MSVENRDLVIERLERQLLEKEKEIEDIKGSLKESILLELREDTSKDVDVKNRLLRLENKVQELTNNINGILDELLDQKSLIRSLGNMQAKANKQPQAPSDFKRSEPQKPPEAVAQPAQKSASAIDPGARPPVPNPQRPSRSRLSVQSQNAPRSSGVRFQARSSNFNIRDAEARPRPEPEKAPEPEPSSEYIIAASGDESSAHFRRQRRDQDDGGSSNYIVAEDARKSRMKAQEREEHVEAREDEDAVITVTRRK